jgi:protein subunit release factor A
MLTDLTRDRLVRLIEWIPRHRYGGQHVGVDRGVAMIHPLFNIKLEVAEYRSQIENRKAAIVIFSAFLDTLPENVIESLNRDYGQEEGNSSSSEGNLQRQD